MKIKEIIVVEGRDDTFKIKKAVQADTIETNGLAINKRTIEKIKLAQQTRGVIIFTDPDSPGERIRHIISENVSGCKHAFLPKKQALEKLGRGVGIEHASVESIREALKNVYQEMIDVEEQISREDLLHYGLMSDERSSYRREILGNALRIGYANGKQLYKRLQMFQIPKQVFEETMNRILLEEENERNCNTNKNERNS